MNFKLKALILLTVLTFSCNDATKNNKVAESSIVQLTETPQILQEPKSNIDYSVSSFSKRNNSDIVSKLFQEAIEKDSKLKKLNEDLNNIENLKSDSITEYSEFKKTNRSYWKSVDNYINRMQDSTIKKSTHEVFKNLRINYQKEMSPYEQKLASINKKAIILNDQLILMKLIVTSTMMKNYQINEKPEIETLNSLIKEYDNLIKATEEYSKIKK
jgi:hypothetical protein